MADQNVDLNINPHVKAQITKVLWRFEQPDSLNFISKIMTFKKGIDLPSDNYSLLNKCILHANDTIDARGYKAWSDVGRKCLKGKNIHILAPKMMTIKDKENPDKKIKIPIGFFPIAVWPDHGTEGDPIDYKIDGELPEFSFQKVADHMGIKVNQVFENKRFVGDYNPDTLEINMATDDELIFCRELANAVHDKFRKKYAGKGINKKDPANKIIAEFSAVVLCNMLGKKVNEKTAYDYIVEYGKKKKRIPTRSIAELLPKMEKIIKYILEANQEKKEKKL